MEVDINKRKNKKEIREDERQAAARREAGRRAAAGRKRNSGGYSEYTEEELDYYRKRRAAAARRRREKQLRRRRRIAVTVIALVLIAVGGTLAVGQIVRRGDGSASGNGQQMSGDGDILQNGESYEEDAAAAASRQQAALASSREQAALDASREAAALASSREQAALDASREAAAQAASEAAAAQAAAVSSDPDVAAFHPGVEFTTDSMTEIKAAASSEGSTDSSEEGSTENQEEGIQSQYAVIVDLDTGAAIAGREATTRMNPASMTKILTLLVAVENIDQSKLDTDKVTIDSATIDYVYSKGMSAVGWEEGDTPTIRDCLYGTILPSGADAAISLAKYVAGSEDAFVELMNQKCEELGISQTTHFTNVVGAYDENHYSTALDIAKILRAAVENDLCREVLSCHTYTVTPSAGSEEGFQISNWFLRRIEDKDTHGTVVAAKTGFVNESGNCAASYQKSNSGGHYICVTGNAPGTWPCIYDHVRIYDTYTN